MESAGQITIPVLIFDTATPEFKENRIFDPEFAAKFPGASMWATMRERASQRGWAVMTADVFLREPSAKAVCVSDMVTPYSKALIEFGVVPAIILSGESPNVAWGFYRGLRKKTSSYHHAYLFRGALGRMGRMGRMGRLSPPVQGHPFYWPNSQREIRSGRDWERREYLVMVAGNKDRFQVSSNQPLGLRRFAKRMVWNCLQLVDPLFHFEDLYQRRLEAICFFAGMPGFKLYGRGWDAPTRLSRHLRVARSLNPTPVDDKLKTMADFRFALCFENCVFPGYVTEKIFDSFFAGCIPVYWGAPDIQEFVPADSMVDARQFENWTDLDHYLRGMSERESEQYREAACSFLASEDFDKFHQDALLDEMISIIESEFAKMV